MTRLVLALVLAISVYVDVLGVEPSGLIFAPLDAFENPSPGFREIPRPTGAGDFAVTTSTHR